VRFATRTFLWSFAPVAVLLAGSFGAVYKLVTAKVQDRLTVSAREMQSSLAHMREASDKHNQGILRVVAQNPVLEAHVQLLLDQKLSTAGSDDAKSQLEAQLEEICSTLGLDILLVSGTDGVPLAGAMQVAGQTSPFDPRVVLSEQSNFFTSADGSYQITSVPLTQGDESLGTLSIGERLHLSDFSTPVILVHDGKVLESHDVNAPRPALESALAGCGVSGECQPRIQGERFLLSRIGGQLARRRIPNIQPAQPGCGKPPLAVDPRRGFSDSRTRRASSHVVPERLLGEVDCEAHRRAGIPAARKRTNRSVLGIRIWQGSDS